MIVANTGKDDDEPQVIRYMSKEALNLLIEAKVDAAVAEYLGPLDAPAMWENIKKHEKILLGNGRPGLIEEMAVTKPMVAKLEAHLQNFSAFELQTKLDRQSFFSRFDTIEKKVDDGIAALTASIKPLTNLYENMTKAAFVIGLAGVVVGGIFVFLLEKANKISELIKWLTN